MHDNQDSTWTPNFRLYFCYVANIKTKTHEIKRIHTRNI